MATEKEIADNIVKTLLVLNELLAGAHRRGLKVEITAGGGMSGRHEHYSARVFREQELAVSPEPQRRK